MPRLPGWVPADVAALVAELTAKDPAARPASAGEVARRAAALVAAEQGSRTGGTKGSPNRRATVLPGRTTCNLPVLDQAAPDQTVPDRTMDRSRRRIHMPGPRVALGVAVVVAAAGPGPSQPAGPGSWLTSNATDAVRDLWTAPRRRRDGDGERWCADRSAGPVRGPSAPAVASHRAGAMAAIQPRQRLGRVVSVTPTGQVAVGSVVLVIGALAPAGDSDRRARRGHPASRVRVKVRQRPRQRSQQRPPAGEPG